MVDISITICTFKRPNLLFECLSSLLKITHSFSFEILVIDNDSQLSAKDVVEKLSFKFEKIGISLKYYNEPVQNIALARNLGVLKANGMYLAFIDDDEIASVQWLEYLYKNITSTCCDGVWGPVFAIFPDSFPGWLKNSGNFDSRQKLSGTRLRGSDCATNNALVRRDVLLSRNGPFRPDMGRTGGSDIELFSWLVDRGANFLWCNEALVFEKIEQKRGSCKWHFRRSYRTGWGLSKIAAQKYGFFRAFLVVSFLKVPLSFFKGIYRSIFTLKNPKAFILNNIINFFGQVGKIGYFFNCSVIEYKGE
jgi:succinoglycan biosynthesis protein ExoM